MANVERFREHRIGVTIADREFSLFWQRRGPEKSRQRWPLLPWALPLVAATGIAIAMPTPRFASGPQITVPLDDSVQTVSVPQRITAARTNQPKLVTARPARLFATATPAPIPAEPSILSQRAALLVAMKSGDPTDWLDASTGESGIVVPGIADAKGCREVVVMTRRADGRNDNAPGTHCD